MGDLRTNQLIGSFGPGAIYDMVNYSVMILSADYWLKSEYEKDLIIHDNAVQSVVQARMQELTNFKINKIYGLMMPPFDNGKENKDETERAKGDVLTHRFPLFHRCNRCDVLCELKKSSKQTRCQHKYSMRENLEPCGSLKEDWKKGILEPVRFIAKCEDGHIQDFDWVNFKKTNCKADCLEHDNFGNIESIFYLEETSKGDFFKSIKINCRSCSSHKTLDEVNKVLKKLEDEKKIEEVSAEFKNIFKCKGSRPWIAEDDNCESCNKTIEFVPRGQSNVYIPLKENYISIPKKDFLSLNLNINVYTDLLFKEHLDFFNSLDSFEMIDEAKIDEIRQAAQQRVPSIIEFRSDEVESTILRNFNEVNESNIQQEVRKYFDFLIDWKISSLNADAKKIELDYKLNEFESLTSTESSEEFICSQINLNDDGYLKSKFCSISKIEKLKIISVLMGFHRSFDIDTNKAARFHPVINQPNYLPSSVIYGEGIFFEFDLKVLNDWKEKNIDFISKRNELLMNRAMNSLQDKDPKDVTYSLVHSFSHMLMKQLAFESGFSVTELTEKLYVLEDEQKVGLLIHTSSGDSQCSMGGLCDLADESKLEGIIKRALISNISCSNDPICIESEGQGTSSLSHAACFGCLMLPETCCEVRPIKNSFLDRNLLIDFDSEIESFF